MSDKLYEAARAVHGVLNRLAVGADFNRVIEETGASALLAEALREENDRRTLLEKHKQDAKRAAKAYAAQRENESMGEGHRAKDLPHLETPNVLLTGDRVCLDPEQPYMWGTVVSVDSEEVEVVRPYLHTSDFSAGERDTLIPYVGMETIKIRRDDPRKLQVLFRTQVPK